ncbi:cobalt ABC transporter ATP-binding protein [Geobacter sulfurreducens]|nr:cobalt ABC transporter ATP-binding protein [Geobacter sulfurreducens]
MTTNTPILELNGVTFRYPDGSVGLDGCSLAIGRGSRTAILGANGAGKTTMFLHLNGILRPLSGRVLYDGVPLDYGRHGLHKLRSRVGLIFQNPDSQLFSASVREDVSFGPMNLGLNTEEVRTRVAASLHAVGLTDYADKPVHNLSFGQKKRVCIAGVLAMQPDVIILDEPMAGLDIAMQAELTRILDRLHGEGMTIIIATHDIDFAYQWADSISILVKGKCDSTWEIPHIPEALDRFASYGLGIPRIAELHNSLVKASLLDTGSGYPRSHQELVNYLNDMSV